MCSVTNFSQVGLLVSFICLESNLCSQFFFRIFLQTIIHPSHNISLCYTSTVKRRSISGERCTLQAQLTVLQLQPVQKNKGYNYGIACHIVHIIAYIKIIRSPWKKTRLSTRSWIINYANQTVQSCIKGVQLIFLLKINKLK